jgi:hypothetical protein
MAREPPWKSLLATSAGWPANNWFLFVLLIHPPLVKPSEPPPGLARLAGALSFHQIKYSLLDANLEALLFRLKSPVLASDSWTRRAERHISEHLDSLQKGRAFENLDRYKRAVNDLSRVLQKAAPPFKGSLTLANYEDQQMSPLRIGDLLRAAEEPEKNPFYEYFSGRLNRLLQEEAPSLVGFSVNYLSQALCALAMAGYLRKQAPALKIIMGGGLITSWLSTGISNPFPGIVDEMVAGPGEEAVLRHFGKKADGRYQPDYRGLKNLPYLSPGFILPYSASSGCYWSRCSFCPERAEGRPYRPIPPDQVISELKSLIHQTRARLVHLVDNALSPALLRHLAADPLPAPWYGFVRISRELTDPDFCRDLKNSGCVMLKVGLESGDQEVLESMGKGITLEEASQTLKNLKEAGITTYVYLLFGTPAENPERAGKTLNYVVAHQEAIGFLNLAIFNMPVHGPEAEMMETGDFYEGDLSLYRQFRHPLGWDRALVRQFLDREFKRHPAVAAILRREPPYFTSNHAPFFKFPGRS